MRLIDADLFKEHLQNELERTLSESKDNPVVDNARLIIVANAICKAIDNRPTAYDIDEVVKRLKQCHGIVSSTSLDYAEGLKNAYERAIEIVKGGIESD